jgi:hypothetical protein
MKTVYQIISYFCSMKSLETTFRPSKVIFWDTDYDQIDWPNKARYVIERVVKFGVIEDWRFIQNYYGMDKIKEEMLQSRDLDHKSLTFLSVLFNIPQEQFRCYTSIQSNQGHWNY